MLCRFVSALSRSGEPSGKSRQRAGDPCCETTKLGPRQAHQFVGCQHAHCFLSVTEREALLAIVPPPLLASESFHATSSPAYGAMNSASRFWRSFGVGYSRNLNCRAPIPLRFTPYGLRPITAPLAAGASNQTVSTCRNPASSSHAAHSARV